MTDAIEIELRGFDESGADGVPPNPWWATTKYRTAFYEVHITSSRRATSWLAIADVIHALHPHLSNAPYAAVRKRVPVNDTFKSERGRVRHERPSETLDMEVIRCADVVAPITGATYKPWIARVDEGETNGTWGWPIRLATTGPREATPWEAIASCLRVRAELRRDVKEDRFRAAAEEGAPPPRLPEVGLEEDGRIQTGGDGDGRYVPSRQVCYSKHVGNDPMPRMRSGAVEALLKELQQLVGPETESYSEHVLRGRIAQALENYRAARTLYALDLPWRESRIDPRKAEAGRDRQIISLSGQLIGNELTAAQARAILNLANVYNKANALLGFFRNADGCVNHDAADGDCPSLAAKLLEEALAEAGWIEK